MESSVKMEIPRQREAIFFSTASSCPVKDTDPAKAFGSSSQECFGIPFKAMQLSMRRRIKQPFPSLLSLVNHWIKTWFANCAFRFVVLVLLVLLVVRDLLEARMGSYSVADRINKLDLGNSKKLPNKRPEEKMKKLQREWKTQNTNERRKRWREKKKRIKIHLSSNSWNRIRVKKEHDVHRKKTHNNNDHENQNNNERRISDDSRRRREERERVKGMRGWGKESASKSFELLSRSICFSFPVIPSINTLLCLFRGGSLYFCPPFHSISWFLFSFLVYFDSVPKEHLQRHSHWMRKTSLSWFFTVAAILSALDLFTHLLSINLSLQVLLPLLLRSFFIYTSSSSSSSFRREQRTQRVNKRSEIQRMKK